MLGLTAGDAREAALGGEAVDDVDGAAGAVAGHGPQRGAALRPGRRERLPRQRRHAVPRAGGQLAQLRAAGALLRLRRAAQHDQHQDEEGRQGARLQQLGRGHRHRRRRRLGACAASLRNENAFVCGLQRGVVVVVLLLREGVIL